MITADTVITAAAVITALGVITGAFAALCKWMERQKEQDEDIAQLKRENTLIVHALCACLDGLEQLGAIHAVPSEEWRAYRRALRDLPEQPGFPYDVEFPSPPQEE